jgi:hypothetical protein
VSQPTDRLDQGVTIQWLFPLRNGGHSRGDFLCSAA